MLKEHGVDLMDVSTGGMVPNVTVPVQPNYQVPFATQVRLAADMPTTAVGLITKPKQAAKIVAKGEADAVEIGRASRRLLMRMRRAGIVGILRHCISR